MSVSSVDLSSLDDDYNECLDLRTVSTSAWDDESLDSKHETIENKDKNAVTNGPSPMNTMRSYGDVGDALCGSIYSLAFTSLGTGITRPSLLIVEMLGCGKGLVATQFLPKGSIVYTERAALACQVLRNDHIRACQNCFRSLEPQNWLVSVHQLPMAHLWPVSEYTLRGSVDSTLLLDGAGRVTCCTCGALFCSKCCHQQLCEQFVPAVSSRSQWQHWRACSTRKQFHRL